MQFRRQSGNSYARCAATLVAAMILTLALATTASAANHEKTLYNFAGLDVNPNGALLADNDGNLYGTTPSSGSGTVFELSPPTTSGGAWTRTVFYSFLGGNTDGAFPYGSLIFDNVGNLFGTTSGGGPNNRGTVFELQRPATAGGTWIESVIFFFPSDLSFGYNPAGKLARDGFGTLYGLASNGGGHASTCDCGTLFSLQVPRVSGGEWTPTVLHNFGLTTGDGATPVGDLTFKNGVFYGVTQHGGSSGNGTIFRMKNIQGVRTVSVLHSFSETDGALPFGRLALDAANNIYGVTVVGGNGYGTAFELSPPAISGGEWQLSTLDFFTGGKDGANPSGPVVLDKAGNIYGTARNGGLRNSQTNNNGTVFELSPPAMSGGAWTETTLHEFGGSVYNDGSQPNFGVILFKGKFYGTTAAGGANNEGTVFSLAVN